MKIRTKGNISKCFETASRVIIALYFFLLTGYCCGQDRIDIQTLIMETQKFSQDHKETTTVWWLPEQFWLSSFAQSPAADKAMTDQFIETLRPYIMIAWIPMKDEKPNGFSVPPG